MLLFLLLKYLLAKTTNEIAIYPRNVSKEKQKPNYLGALLAVTFSFTLNLHDAKHYVAAVSVHHHYTIRVTFLLFPPCFQLIVKTSA